MLQWKKKKIRERKKLARRECMTIADLLRVDEYSFRQKLNFGRERLHYFCKRKKSKKQMTPLCCFGRNSFLAQRGFFIPKKRKELFVLP